MPELEVVRKEMSDAGVRFLALSLEPDEQLTLSAARELGLEMTVATTEVEVLGPLGVNRLPSSVYVDASGTIVAAASGERSASFHRKRVRQLTGQ